MITSHAAGLGAPEQSSSPQPTTEAEKFDAPAPPPLSGWASRLSPRLLIGVLSGSMASVVMLQAISGVQSWIIAAVFGLLAGVVGWLAAEGIGGRRPPAEGDGSRW